MLALLGMSGCVSNRTVRYHTAFPGAGSQYTLAGTEKDKVLKHVGTPTSITTGADGEQTLYYHVRGTREEDVSYIFCTEHRRRPIETDVHVFINNGLVTGGEWTDNYGHSGHW
jgi:hypothetical protein